MKANLIPALALQAFRYSPLTELHFIVSLGTVFHLFSSSANFRQLSRPISRAYDLCRHTGSRKGPELGVLISAADLKFSIILNKAHAVSFCAGSHK